MRSIDRVGRPSKFAQFLDLQLIKFATFRLNLCIHIPSKIQSLSSLDSTAVITYFMKFRFFRTGNVSLRPSDEPVTNRPWNVAIPPIMYAYLYRENKGDIYQSNQNS
jgi:hypothetical protein